MDKKNHSCYICNTHEDEFDRSLAVDHCHETGKVRHLLCINCNGALGMMKENIGLMKKLINYVETECK